MSEHVVQLEERNHRAKWWEIMFFSMNNAATNIYLFGFMFLSYYLSGFLGLATVSIGYVLGFTRLFDGLIDPAIGVSMDNTNTKFGKYRPFMVGGNIILIISFLILFNSHNIENGVLRYIVLIIALIVHKTGYSFQATVTKAAQPILTSDPKQRPLFSIWDTLFTNVFVFTLGQIFISQVLVPRNGGDFSLSFFKEFIILIMIISVVFTVFAVIGIWRKDNEKYFGLGEETVETKSLKEYWGVLKGNKPFLLLISSAALAKFAGSFVGEATVTVLLFGIVLGNYALSGTVSAILLVPQIAVIVLLSFMASRKGQKSTFLISVVLSALSLVLMGVLLISNDTREMFLTSAWQPIVFTVLYIAIRIFSGYPATVSLTMTADVSEYETARSGRYVSGMMGTMFSLTDSITSSLTPIVVTWVIAAIGFRDSFPSLDTAYSNNIFLGMLILFIILPLILLVIVGVLIFMYPLNSDMMSQTRRVIDLKKDGIIPHNVNGFDYAKENNIDLDAPYSQIK